MHDKLIPKKAVAAGYAIPSAIVLKALLLDQYQHSEMLRTDSLCSTPEHCRSLNFAPQICGFWSFYFLNGGIQLEILSEHFHSSPHAVDSTDGSHFGTDISKATKFSGSAWFQGVNVKSCPCTLAFHSPRHDSGHLNCLHDTSEFCFAFFSVYVDLVYGGYFLEV